MYIRYHLNIRSLLGRWYWCTGGWSVDMDKQPREDPVHRLGTRRTERGYTGRLSHVEWREISFSLERRQLSFASVFHLWKTVSYSKKGLFWRMKTLTILWDYVIRTVLTFLTLAISNYQIKYQCTCTSTFVSFIHWLQAKKVISKQLPVTQKSNTFFYMLRL